MGQYVIGLDNGGTSTKAAIFDLQGKEIATLGKDVYKRQELRYARQKEMRGLE